MPSPAVGDCAVDIARRSEYGLYQFQNLSEAFFEAMTGRTSLSSEIVTEPRACP